MTLAIKIFSTYNTEPMNRAYLAILIISIFLIISCADTAPVEEPPFEITAILDTIIQDWEGRDKFIDEYNRLTNSDLTIIQPPHQQYMDKLLVSISSGKVPDVFEILPEYLSLFIEQGIALELDTFLAESKYANGVNSEYLDAIRYSGGKLFAFPARDGGGCVTYIRKDWLDNMGLPVPRNWPEMYRTMQAFAFKDPDGNGVDDTYAYTDVNAASEDWYNRIIMQDAFVEIYNKNGTWVDGFTEPQMVGALERLKGVFEDALIDPNFFSNTTYAARTRFFNGDVGIFTYWGNHWARNLQSRTASAESAAVEVVPIPAIEQSRYLKRIGPILVINKNSEDPAKVFNDFIDRQYDKGEMQTLFTYGVRGYHWDIVDGDTSFLENPFDPYKAHFTRCFVPPSAILNDWDQPMKLDPLVETVLFVLNSNSRQQKMKYGGEYYTKYFLELQRSLKPKIISNIVTNELSIEEGLEMYRRESRKLFVDEILAEMNNLK